MSRLSGFLFDSNCKDKSFVQQDADRERFLKSLRLQRLQRQEDKRRIDAAVKIESAWRGYSSRKQQSAKFRSKFDCGSFASAGLLNTQLRRFVSFYDQKSDGERLITLCQELIKAQSSGVVSNISTYIRGCFLSFCIRYLEQTRSSSKPIALPMRVLELFLRSTQTLFARDDIVFLRILLAKGFYEPLRALFDAKIPLDILPSSSAPVPLAATLFDLLRSPIEIAQKSGDPSLRSAALVSFTKHFLCQRLTSPVTNFVIPALIAWSEFSLDELLASFITQESSSGYKSIVLRVPSTVELLYCILKLYQESCDQCPNQLLLFLGACLRPAVSAMLKLSYAAASISSQGDEELAIDAETSAERMEVDTHDQNSPMSLANSCLDVLNQDRLVESLWLLVKRCNFEQSYLRTLCNICYTTMHFRNHSKQSRLLYMLSFKSDFVREVWMDLSTSSVPSMTGPKLLLEQLRKGFTISPAERDIVIPQLSVFCALFSNTLLAVHDAEFYTESCKASAGSGVLPFSLQELAVLCSVLRDIALSLVELAFPDARPDLGENYKDVLINYCKGQDDAETYQWNKLFETTVHLLRLLYDRDVRIQFCPKRSWCCATPISVLNQKMFRRSKRGQTQLFGSLRLLSRQELEDQAHEGFLSSSELRNLTVLRKLPFVVPFEDRVKLIQQLIVQDKEEGGVSSSFGGFHHGKSIYVNVRRNFLYEDAFEKLSIENEPNLRIPIRVHMLNWAGLDEAGIDGGGIFREFLSELLQTGFDPTRGFFLTTPHEGLLYPNPAAPTLFPDTFHKHYYFLGRMLGKLLYEGLLAELPFAGFFLSKLLSVDSSDVDIHHLCSLDPVLYKNLLYLKLYEGDVMDLELDFSVVVEELGEIKKIDLKPNGRNLRVDNVSKIEYVHLVADWYLNRQIRMQTFYFRQGLADLIYLDWLGLFDYRELQILISGADIRIDLNDMRAHTVYSNGYSDQHEVVGYFWTVINEFTEEQRKKLLKFVTSCSRPPLLGFKDLYPPFNVQMVAQPDRLPTAATCMNLLKLPVCPDLDSMWKKLLYAIESGTGFELS